MKHALATLLLAAVSTTAAVVADIEHPWERVPSKPDKSQGAMVSQMIGADTWVRVAYHRPAVRDRDVWNDTNSRGARIVPQGDDAKPWRAGANEATTFEVSKDVQVEGLDLPAGKYALFMIPGEDHWVVIFNSEHDQWGSGSYDESKDVVRINIVPESAPHNEFLQYGFDYAESTWARCYMHWAKLKIAFEVGQLPTR